MKKLSYKTIVTFLQKHLFIIVILLIGLGLRLYRLPEMASYDFDQEYVTTFVLQVVKEYPIRYVGQGLSIQGLFMGPFYFYYLVPFYMLFQLNPLGGMIGSLILGLLIILLYYVVGKSLFSTKVGLLAAFIRAIGFYAIQADWSMVPSYSSDLAVLLTWWLLYQLWQGKSKYLPALFFIFGMYSSFHPVQFPFVIVFFILMVVWKLQFTLKEWLLSVVAFVIPVAPLLLFEYWRNWSMVKIIMAASSASTSPSHLLSFKKLSKITDILLDHWADLWNIPHSWVVLSVALAGCAVWLLWKTKNASSPKKTGFHLPALFTLVIVFLLYYSLLPFNVPEYYLRGTQTIFLLYLAMVLAFLLTQKWGLILAAGILLFSIWENTTQLQRKWLQTDLTTLAYKQRIIDHIEQRVHGEPFQISYIAKPGWGSGFTSLFAVSPQQPGAEGPVYTIIVPMIELSNDSYDFISGGIGITYPDED